MSVNLFLPFNLSRPWLTRSLTPYLFRPIKSCSQIAKEGQQQGHVSDIKAPSTADEFRRVAQEKQNSEEEGSFPDEQGIPGETTQGNAFDDSEESGGSKVDTGAEEMSEKHKSEPNH